MNFPFSFRPKLVDALKDYSAQKFYADAMAGFTVGIVALPLSMALAIASGLKPEIGIFTAIIGGLLVSALGGSLADRGAGGRIRAAARADCDEARARGAGGVCAHGGNPLACPGCVPAWVAH